MLYTGINNIILMSIKTHQCESNNQATSCCVCLNTTRSNNNFSGWQCTGKHSEKMCNYCLGTLMKMTAKCPICRAHPFYNWGRRIADENRTEIRKKKFGSKYALMKKYFDYKHLIEKRLDGKYIYIIYDKNIKYGKNIPLGKKLLTWDKRFPNQT